MDLDVGCPDGTPDYAEPVPDPDSDWTWPAADTFTDDSIARRPLQTCSELGSQRIRLIKIRPGRPKDGIECDTKVCFLSEAGEYTALTYTWGSPIERRVIVVDEQPRLVTVNLCRFLEQARRFANRFSCRFSGWLWIDALSIEQSDPWEKLKQVGMISQIFKNAKRVVIWLGPTYGDSDRAMKVLAAMSKESTYWKVLRGLLFFSAGPAILGLCQRPYWHRLWVLQELKASQATDLLCGSYCVNLESLESLLFHNNADQCVGAIIRASQDSPAAKMLSSTNASSKASLRAMLDATSHLLCSDPRDKVYAILNVASTGSQDIDADYTITLADVANRVLRNMHTIQEPSSLQDIHEQCESLEKVFRMHPGSIYATGTKALASCSSPLPLLQDRPIWTLTETRLDAVFENLRAWCEYHNHQVLARMLREWLVDHYRLGYSDLEVLGLDEHSMQAFMRHRSQDPFLKIEDVRKAISRMSKSLESIYHPLKVAPAVGHLVSHSRVSHHEV